MGNLDTVDNVEIGEFSTKLWNKYFVFACIVSLFIGFAMNMVNSTMAKYVYSLYGNASFSGLLNAAFAVMAIIGRLIAGNLSDRKGRRMVTLFGCCIFAVCIFCFGFFPYAAALIIFRGLQGLGYSMSSTSVYAAGSDVLPSSRISEGIGYLGLGYSLATAVGPAIALGIISRTGFGFMFCTAMGLILGGAVFSLVNNYEKQPEFQKIRKRASELRTAKRKGIEIPIEQKSLPATVTQLFHSLAFAFVNSFIVIFAESRGIAGTSLFFTFMAIAMCLSKIFSGRLTDKYGVLPVAGPCLIGSVIAFIMLIFVQSSAVLFLAGVLLGISNGTVNPALQSAAVKAAPIYRRGTANGTYQLSTDIANGLGSVIWGLAIDVFGYPAAFVGCIVSVFISLFLLIKYFRNAPENV